MSTAPVSPPNRLLDQVPRLIRNWHDLAQAQDLFRRIETEEKPKPQEWVFRGIPDKAYGLKTTLERVAEEFGVEGALSVDLEVKLILEFMRRYHLYSYAPLPKQGDTLDWLAVMRHHGAPCRFLDFTFSFLVAAYFALDDYKENGVPTIWAINKSWLTIEVPEILERHGGKGLRTRYEECTTYRDGDAFRDIFMDLDFMKLEAKPQLVTTVGPFRLNERLTIQQGLFLCPGNVMKSFDENLRAMPNKDANAFEITIEPSIRSELLVGLLRANLTRASLFPGLDGFATSLRNRVPALKNLKSMEDNDARSKINLDIKSLALR